MTAVDEALFFCFSFIIVTVFHCVSLCYKSDVSYSTGSITVVF